MAFLSTLCFSISNCIWAKPLRKLPFLTIICLRAALSSLIFWMLFLSDPDLNQQVQISFRNMAQAVLISIVSSVGLLLYTYSLKFTKVSVAVPTNSINSFFGVLTAFIVLHEVYHWKVVPVFPILCLGLILIDRRSSVAGKRDGVYAFRVEIVYSARTHILYQVLAVYKNLYPARTQVFIAVSRPAYPFFLQDAFIRQRFKITSAVIIGERRRTQHQLSVNI